MRTAAEIILAAQARKKAREQERAEWEKLKKQIRKQLDEMAATYGQANSLSIAIPSAAPIRATGERSVAVTIHEEKTPLLARPASAVAATFNRRSGGWLQTISWFCGCGARKRPDDDVAEDQRPTVRR